MNSLTLVHGVIREHIKKHERAFCIDATAGRGRDTAFLCRTVGESGRVIAFDIQREAVESTKALLKKEGLFAEVYMDSHENMGLYADECSVDCIVFNLGYLPGGSHKIFTNSRSSIAAITGGLSLIKDDGIICVSIYHGGDTGYAERDELLQWLEQLDGSRYQVIVTKFHNWKNDPPIPVFITKA